MKLREKRNEKDKLAVEKAARTAAQTKTHATVTSRALKVPTSTTRILKSLLIRSRRLK